MDTTIRRSLGLILLGLTVFAAGLITTYALTDVILNGGGTIISVLSLIATFAALGGLLTALYGLGRLIWSLLRG